MLTRSQKCAAAAAESPSAEDQRGDEISAMGMKLPTDWTELPAEMLMKIFDNLTIEPRTSKEQRKSLLNIRLVHPRWKSAIDDLLEQRSLSFWKKGTYPPDNNPYMFPVVRFNPTGKQTLEHIQFPSFLLGDQESCPFPTSSVRLTSTPVFENGPFLSSKGDAHFFSKYGHHLTSLTIDLLERYVTALTLQQLLICTPNLKAMTFKLMMIKMLVKDVGKISLPPLPHLEHVRLQCIYSGSSDFDVQNWILEPYKEQLITLRCTEDLRCKNSPEFPFLKQIRLFCPTPQLLLSPMMFPTLRIVDLRMIKLSKKIGPGRINLYHVFKFVSGVAGAVVELRLDIVKEQRSKAKPINYEQDHILQELQEIQKSRFPALKKLFITYPNSEEDMKIVKDFLKMFPNLETLNLTRFEIRPTGSVPTEFHRAAVSNHLDKVKYHEVCLKLRAINVYMNLGGDSPFFTSRFPFTA